MDAVLAENKAKSRAREGELYFRIKPEFDKFVSRDGRSCWKYERRGNKWLFPLNGHWQLETVIQSAKGYFGGGWERKSRGKYVFTEII